MILISCDYVSLKGLLDPRIPHVWIDCNDPPELTKEICQVQSDQLAAGVYPAVSELGIRIPEEMRIIGYDGVSVATRTLLNITSIRQDVQRIAGSAAEMIVAQMERRPIETRRVIVPVSILSGQTL